MKRRFRSLTCSDLTANFERLAPGLAEGATSDLFAGVAETPGVQTIARRLESGESLSLTSIASSAQPFLAALLARALPDRPILVVAHDLRAQERIHQDLETWLAIGVEGNPGAPSGTETQSVESRNVNKLPRDLLFFPSWEILPHESRLPHVDVISERLETLVALSIGSGRSPAPIVVTSAVALLQRTFPVGYLSANTRTFSRGDRIDPLDLVEWLEEHGYEPEAQVTHKGEISLRGGILDIFPLTSPWPVRLEFFGNELESLRFFDPLTQVSREEINRVQLPPAGELSFLKRRIQDLVPGNLFDYLPSRTVVLICEPEIVEAKVEAYATAIPPADPFFVSWSQLLQEAALRRAPLVKTYEGGSDVPETRVPTDIQHPAEAAFQSLDAFRPVVERPPDAQVAEVQRREFFHQMHRWTRQGYHVHVFCNNQGERQRFEEIWREYAAADTPEALAASCQTADGRLSLHLGVISRGFLFEAARLVIVTDAEIFGRYKVQRPRRLKSHHAQAVRSALDIDFTDLDDGDFVVHLQHGIGRYVGLQVLPLGSGTRSTQAGPPSAISGASQECLVIEYAPSDPGQPAPRLYVPVTEAHLVSKYVGTGKAHPPLNTLGGARWARAKAQAERAVKDVASELLAIQAARESQQGHAFPADTPWQREFESSFVYEETLDQIRAIEQTKEDMESVKPMDRLICGDVGFGKTEVGIRAAFKAVMGGRQVAVLVPTTILAQQHYNTFRERMADYPIRVELLSRFRTRRDQQRVIGDLAAGAVDIIIGTHRLLQGDIGFKDLGLVVIDEEQRFGVMHKEKFKMLRRLVDVLTLSATPIPRTLYLALTGARDMSTIQTPPHDRLPVETIVTQYDERVIRDAIFRELNRGGQVFFLHNRVLTIGTMAHKLQALVPHARIVVGHGQMDSDDLEEVMAAFINGEADVLLSTTIIESGLDIPNANTIIIDRADRFGLSDLYQLRGRVGRYKHQAYAYLLLPRHASLLSDVRKRLSAIKQYSTLGSGFKIAMRDLEIRGAGNLLGAEQSGHITAVGFELYCQLLKQSVASLKGEKVGPRIEVVTRLDFLLMSPLDEVGGEDVSGRHVPTLVPEQRSPAESQPGSQPAPAAAYIPLAYISDSRQRIEVYRKLAQVTDKAALQALTAELRDRFGPLPAGVDLLLLLVELKTIAAGRGVTAIEVKEDKLMITRGGDYVMINNKFPRLKKNDAAARLKEIRKLLLVI